MNRFLVVSYDTDEQQWFYDIVLADSSEAAIEWVCKHREYVVGADALSAAELKLMGERAGQRSDDQIRAHMDELVEAYRERNEEIPT